MAVLTVPEGRYGKPRRRTGSRWRYWAMLGVFVAAGVIVAYVAYVNLGADPIDPEVTNYRVVDDHYVTTDFTVDRDHPNQAADCIVYALSSDGDEAGRIEIYVPPSETTVHLTAGLHTDKRATTVEFYGCSYQVPPYLIKSMPPSG
jgi:hypothetical protein